jgi:hypothetical protein
MATITRLNFRNFRNISLILLFSSIAFLIALSDRAPIHVDKRIKDYDQKNNNAEKTERLITETQSTQFEAVSPYIHGVLDRTYSGPFVYRILIPGIEQTINNLFKSISLSNIDFFLKIILLIICQMIFYLYLRIFFPLISALAGVLLLDVYIGFALTSLIGQTVVETMDLFNLLIFTLGLIYLWGDKFFLLIITLFIGTINRETTWLFLPIIIVFDLYSKRKLRRSILAFVSIAIPFFTIRLLINPMSTDWFTLKGIVANIPFLDDTTHLKAIVANIKFLIIFGPLLILSLYKFSEHPSFLKAASSVTPVFILAHYVFGTIIETRLWMPLFVILIPLLIDSVRRYSDIGPDYIQTG